MGEDKQVTYWRLEPKAPFAGYLCGPDWGLRTAVGLAGITDCFVWYQSRPKPPKPWNRTAINAEYDSVGTEGDKNNIVSITYARTAAQSFAIH